MEANIDKLASQGMRFTQAYAAAALCSPTRVACLTGRYPARVGITYFITPRFRGGMVPHDKKNPSGYVLNEETGLKVAVKSTMDGARRSNHCGGLKRQWI